MKNKNFGRKRQAIYILSNRKSTRIIKTLMDFFFFIKVKIKMVCFSVPSFEVGGVLAQWLYWAKYLQAILACPAILLPRHGHVFLLSNCPDTDSLCCQHPSYLFTDVDRCIMISVHLISTLTVIDMPFPDSLDICQCQRIYFFQKWIFPFIHGRCVF